MAYSIWTCVCSIGRWMREGNVSTRTTRVRAVAIGRSQTKNMQIGKKETESERKPIGRKKTNLGKKEENHSYNKNFSFSIITRLTIGYML